MALLLAQLPVNDAHHAVAEIEHPLIVRDHHGGLAPFMHLLREKIDAAGHGSLIAQFPTVNTPTGLAFDSSGNLYVTNQPNQGSGYIKKLSPTGADLGIFSSSGVSGPSGLAFDSNGNLYVANSSNNTIEKFSSTGTDLGVFASSGLNNPVGLAFDANGNLYASNYGDATIRKFDSAGNGSLFAHLGAYGFYGIAFDSNGNLYVADLQDNSIRKFDSAGNSTVFASAGSKARFFISIRPGAMSVPTTAPGATADGMRPNDRNEADPKTKLASH